MRKIFNIIASYTKVLYATPKYFDLRPTEADIGIKTYV